MLLISSSITCAVDAGAPSSLGRLRELIARQLGHTAALCGAVPTVQLLACELVTNVLKHCDDHCCTFHLDLGDRIRIEVRDSSAVLPMPRRAEPWEEGGRGFASIGGLADARGAARASGGKRVWCEMRVPGPG